MTNSGAIRWGAMVDLGTGGGPLFQHAAAIYRSGAFYRSAAAGSSNALLWNGNWGGNPNNGSLIANVYYTGVVAAGVPNLLVSQGLA
jgi:hypothetical protein